MNDPNFQVHVTLSTIFCPIRNQCTTFVFQNLNIKYCSDVNVGFRVTMPFFIRNTKQIV